MFPQFQRPLLDKVDCKALGGRNDTSVLRVLDPTQDHLHVVYLIILFFKSWATLLRIQVPLKIPYASSSPPAT